ncbi:YfcE family phosphodiesterase [Massilia sp. CCM 8695]|uniref:Phosphoesterase n=1 Tax=Massilia frigida TaxID=2609281 RepID=A0ABX0MZT6_9BURK|nr:MULTISPECIES: metallophosphoesterase family protein [Massilia]MDM5179937.1 metallophosphoesterase family protein [Massilia sp. DJPM01]NHZ78312.1 YfcE family phosphodiesterase [Massilia frigida]
MLRIGVLSDTHGLLRPEALAFLAGSDFIVHGGDIGNAAMLAQLAAIAPLTVVRGNNDTGEWAASVPHSATLAVGGVRLFALHDIGQLDAAALPDDVRVVVYGHSHRPLAEQRGPLLYLNPGSAGPRRFSLPVSAAELLVDGDRVRANIVELISRP